MLNIYILNVSLNSKLLLHLKSHINVKCKECTLTTQNLD